jgi:hypothetical protein
MQLGSLYDQALELSPRAARIAAVLLMQDRVIPASLRRSLNMILVSGEEQGERMVPWTPVDREAKAAVRFVQACQEVCLSEFARHDAAAH